MDFTVCHPLQSSQKPWSGPKAQASTSLQEKRKSQKYREACSAEGWTFIPAAFEKWEGMGLGAKDVLWKLLKRAVGGVSPELRSLRMQDHRQHLSLALMRQVWKLLGA